MRRIANPNHRQAGTCASLNATNFLFQISLYHQWSIKISSLFLIQKIIELLDLRTQTYLIMIQKLCLFKYLHNGHVNIYMNGHEPTKVGFYHLPTLGITLFNFASLISKKYLHFALYFLIMNKTYASSHVYWHSSLNYISLTFVHFSIVPFCCFIWTHFVN